jgi:hypothetical protein
MVRQPFYELGENEMLSGNSFSNQAALLSFRWALPRKLVLGVILAVALIAFEIFNFDTTRYALESLLGDVNFLGLSWAIILAIAFCAIDFAGLSRLFTPEDGAQEARSTWYLMGAWLLGATMNAMMTWWAVNLTLLNHELGNEILSREELLRYVPLFVAVLVWLTRILFIGAFSIAGSHLFDAAASQRYAPPARSKADQVSSAPGQSRPAAKPSNLPRRPNVQRGPRPVPVGMQAESHRRS